MSLILGASYKKLLYWQTLTNRAAMKSRLFNYYFSGFRSLTNYVKPRFDIGLIHFHPIEIIVFRMEIVIGSSDANSWWIHEIAGDIDCSHFAVFSCSESDSFNSWTISASPLGSTHCFLAGREFVYNVANKFYSKDAFSCRNRNFNVTGVGRFSSTKAQCLWCSRGTGFWIIPSSCYEAVVAVIWF